MTWTAETSCGRESAKIASLAVPYLQGRWLDLGCGGEKCWPSAIGMDKHEGAADIAGDISDLSMFADASMDAVFSSHALEDFTREQTQAILREWLRVLKIGGFLVLYVPSANLYPKMGEPGANQDHRQDIYPGDIEGILQSLVVRHEDLTEEYADSGVDEGAAIIEAIPIADYGLRLRESEERSGTNEYSLYIVVEKTLSGWEEAVWQRSPDGKKRALVCRFGAIGDQLQTSTILPGLKAQGYHITYCTTPKGREVVRYDPHIDDWWLQDTDFVPNAQLGPYFESVMERFDLFVNLCESIEGALLQIPNRVQHGYPEAVRRKLFGTVNYLERMHDIAGVPHDFRTKFYPLKSEADVMRKWRAQVIGDVPAVNWAINGSSMHKIWPYTHVVIKWLLERTPCHVVLNGDNGFGKSLQDGIVAALEEEGVPLDRVHRMAGVWTIRQALTYALMADVMVGPETGLLNAVGLEAVPKVVYLSHSSPENLTKHWRNATVLLPDAERAPCYPCHRLHYDWTYCPKDTKANAALCASSIPPEAVFEAIAMALGATVMPRELAAAD